MGCDDEPMIVRKQQPDDYEAIRHVYAEAFRHPRFRRPQDPGSVPPEVGLFEALWEAGDAIPELSFTALTDGGVVGHVTASRATVSTDPVVAVGPIGVLPDHQGTGIGSALMARTISDSARRTHEGRRAYERASLRSPLVVALDPPHTPATDPRTVLRGVSAQPVRRDHPSSPGSKVEREDRAAETQDRVRSGHGHDTVDRGD